MIPLSLAEVAQATGGELHGPAELVVTGVCTDSRAVSAADLFIAIAGEHHDGHDHALAAVAAGASAVLSQRPLDVPCVVVAEPVAAVGRLANAVIERLPELTVVALTGSSGKTSTKDLLAQVLPALGPTIAPAGSANNELGLPLTVLRADEATRFLVLEMGARGVGHIAYLCGIAAPDIAVVLNVGHAHVGEFGDQATIGRAKSELVSALKPGGVAVLNADDPIVAAMASKAPGRVITFGESAADVQVTDLRLDQLARPSFRLVHEGKAVEVTLHLSGEHAAVNAAAAAAAALAAGLDLATAADRLSSAEPQSRWRMEVTHSSGGVVLVNDAYNANPESTRAALKSLAAMSAGGRSWAVLGEMLELGDSSTDAHDSIGRLAVRLDISRLVAVGEGARPIHMGAAHEGSWGEESTWVPDTEAAVALLRAELRPGDVVLVKASRSVGLEKVVEALMDGGTS